MVFFLFLSLCTSTSFADHKVIVNLWNYATMRYQLKRTDEHTAKGCNRIIIVTQKVNVDVEQLLKQSKANIVNRNNVTFVQNLAAGTFKQF